MAAEKTYQWYGAGNCITPTGRIIIFDKNNCFTTADSKLQKELDDISEGQHLFDVTPETALAEVTGAETTGETSGAEVQTAEQQSAVTQEGMTASVKGVVSAAALAAAKHSNSK